MIIFIIRTLYVKNRVCILAPKITWLKIIKLKFVTKYHRIENYTVAFLLKRSYVGLEAVLYETRSIRKFSDRSIFDSMIFQLKYVSILGVFAFSIFNRTIFVALTGSWQKYNYIPRISLASFRFFFFLRHKNGKTMYLTYSSNKTPSIFWFRVNLTLNWTFIIYNL